jgi:hypothetical protein
MHTPLNVRELVKIIQFVGVLHPQASAAVNTVMASSTRSTCLGHRYINSSQSKVIYSWIHLYVAGAALCELMP